MYPGSTNEIPGSAVDEYCLWPAGRQLQRVLYSRVGYHRRIIQVLGQSRQVTISHSVARDSELTASSSLYIVYLFIGKFCLTYVSMVL